MINIFNNNTYSLVKQGLEAATTRANVISNNMANVNTKGYKRFQVTFEENLKKDSKKIELKKTKSKHINNSNTNSNIQISRDEDTSMNLDGNNVNIDLEKIDQAANSLMYNALITAANSKLNGTKYVITGGNS